MKTNLVGPLEEQILSILWDCQTPLKPADVKSRLRGDHAYTTIMTVLKRLADKKVLRREPDGKAFVYCPCVSREEFLKSNLSTIYGNLVDNYGKLAISQFVDAVKSNKKDLDILKKYLLDTK